MKLKGELLGVEPGEAMRCQRVLQQILRLTSAVLLLAACSRQPSVSSYTVTLEAADPEWTATGIWINAGDRITFRATGRIFWDPAVREPEVGPNGASWTPSTVQFPSEFLLPDVAIASLIGRIGGKVFPIGVERVIEVDTSGELLLGINERWQPGAWNDNQGSFQVTIYVE